VSTGERTETLHLELLAPAQLPRPIPPKAWKWFLGLEGLFALIYFPFGIPPEHPFIAGIVPWMEWPGQVFAWAALGLSAVAAIAYGIVRNRPNAPIAWWFLGGGVLLFITGDTAYKFWHQILGQQQIPFPSFIDAIYVTMYPTLAIGLLLLARARTSGGDRASLIDALTVTAGMFLLSWVFLIGPNVRSPGDLLVRLTAAAYPLGDILVLAMLAHLWSGGGFRHVAGRLLGIGTLGTLVADSIYGITNLHASWNWSDGNPVDLGWILFYSCWGAAALHPSMRALSEPKPPAVQRTTRRRLVLLAVASLIAPAMLFIEIALGKTDDVPIIAVVAAFMFILVFLRLTGLVHAHERALGREQVLRKSAAELVLASGRGGIYQGAIEGVTALAEGRNEVERILVAMVGPTGSAEVVARSGPILPDDDAKLSELWSELLARHDRGELGGYLNPAAWATTWQAGAPPSEELVVPLLAMQELCGFIVMTSTDTMPIELRSSVEVLAAQVEMALDREAMTEAVHTRQSEARFQTLVQNASDVILIAKSDATIVYQSTTAMRTFGYASGSLEGKRFTSLVHPSDIQHVLAEFTSVTIRPRASTTTDLRMRDSEGMWRYVEVTITNLMNEPTVEGIVINIRDVSDRKGLEEELKHQAFHDGLCGLANRALFANRLEHALRRAAQSQSSLAVVFLDLDDFKMINDSLGHAAGDRILVAVARRLINCLKADDTAARFGGDEFAVLLEGMSSPAEACDVAERIIAELRVPLMIDDREMRVHASIGIAYSQYGADEPADLLQASDVAMYAAKAKGKGSYQVYQPSLRVGVAERLGQTADLHRAVENPEFLVHYQPVVSLTEGTTIGFEALVRWQHPEKGILLPDEFIPLSEDTGLVVLLDRWVLREACYQMGVWQRDCQAARNLRISVNVSARHFRRDELLHDVLVFTREAGLDPSCLVLEITERAFVDDAEAVVDRMLKLKALGVSFAIDDFGTGYSSLSYLRSFPIDVLKLDKSFVDDVGRSHESDALVNTIVQLGRSLHLQTVAEGIEEPRQIEMLRGCGCDLGQGNLLSRPLWAHEVVGYLTGVTGGGPVLNGLDVLRSEETVG
jgi:diguanylate cyclase (GGDEF)-like protein/PAS domain S-box-containing protein